MLRALVFGLLAILGAAGANGADLAGKVAVITGSSSGLGMELAKIAVAERMRLVLVDIRPAASHALAEAYRKDGGEAVVVEVDLALAARRHEVIDATTGRFGRIDYLFNNAGYAYLAPLAEQELDAAHRNFEVNYWAYVDLAQRVVPLMRAQGGGHIVNISSILGTVPAPPGYGVYSATKHALVGMFSTAARELESQGIRVKVVCPAGMRTGIAANAVGVGVDHAAMQKVVDGWEDPANVAREIFARMDEPEVLMFPTVAGERMKPAAKPPSP